MQFIIIFLGLAALFGASVSLLVSKNLAASVGIQGVWRYVLATGLSFGVISVAIKTLIAVVISTHMQWFHSDPAKAKQARGMDVGVDYPPGPGYRAWQALEAPPRAPLGNEVTPGRAALGRRLFHDARLSADGEVSCASCHDVDAGGDDNRATSIGIEGLTGTRNAPTVLNAGYLTRFFWDGRAVSLEDQAKGPLVNPVEMAMPSLDEVVRIVSEDDEYPELFREAYGEARPIDADAIAKAIANYERTLYSLDAPYDRFVRGDEAALSAEQQYGMLLFSELGCRSCHVDPTFSAKDIGLYRRFPVFADSPLVARYDFVEDKGRLADTKGAKSGLWRVPSLRNVARTAPYFHNGSVDQLEEAIQIMASAQLNYTIVEGEDPSEAFVWDPQARRMARPPKQSLTPKDIAALRAFLESLSSPSDETPKTN